MMNLSKHLIILFAFPLFGYAQESDIKFGKVSEEELNMSVYAADSSASAVVLSDIGETRFIYNQTDGIQLEFTRHTRIKIFNSAGYEWANGAILLYHSGNNKEKIMRLRGYTYNLVDGKIEEEKLRNEHQFTEDYDERYDIEKFSMPAVREGSVLEYEYTVVSDFLFNLQDWEFQKTIPVIWSEYKVGIPEYFRYKQLMQGYHVPVVSENKSERDYFTITYKTEDNGNRYVTQKRTHNEKVEFSKDVYRWVFQNLPALVEESYITSMNDYVMKINFELASTNFPGELPKIYTTTWENIDKELLDHADFGGTLNKKAGLKEALASITSGSETKLEKLNIIYHHMRDGISWNGDARLFASKSTRNTLEDKSGNSADINLSLIALLREAGIDAYPMVLSTRTHGMIRQQFPMLTQFNYVVAVAMLDEKSFIMDATEDNCPVNLLPLRCLNNTGRLVDEGFADRWVQITAPSANKLVVANMQLNDQHQIEGQVSSSMTDYFALKMRQQYSQEQEANRQSQLTENNSNWQVKDYHSNGFNELDAPLKEEFTVIFSDGIMEAGNLIYINPMMIDRIEKNPFKLENRAYPVDFAHPSKYTYMMNLQIPEGYELEEAPEAIMLMLPEGGGSYAYQVKQMGNVLQLVSKLDLHKSRFYAQEYPFLKEFYNRIVDKQAEQLVLRKQKTE